MHPIEFTKNAALATNDDNSNDIHSIAKTLSPTKHKP